MMSEIALKQENSHWGLPSNVSVHTTLSSTVTLVQEGWFGFFLLLFWGGFWYKERANAQSNDQILNPDS